MRVIAGSAGGIRLAVAKRGVRPTMDRVKAAIFSSLGDSVAGARVLDLFAGSGALGIEALSRGASSAVFVEEDRQSVEIIERNELNGMLELAMQRLPEQQRIAVIFSYHENMSNGEIAQVMDTTVAAVESLLKRGRQQLRQLLRKHERDIRTAFTDC